MKTEQIFQIHILLKKSQPRIWRRILVSSETLLSDLHKIIQTVMGWTNTHLHQFRKGDQFYALPFDDDDFEFYKTDYSGIAVKELLLNEGDKIIYDYDFGDSWEHDIRLEKILHPDTPLKYPVCIKGKRACPPEDCGGIWGYENMLEILKDKQHEEYKDIVEWLGDDDYDPEYFDIEEVNELLKEEDFGCINWLYDE